MKVSDLKALLDGFSDDQEIAVSISASDSDDSPILTYAIGYEKNEYDELVLQVDGF
jgi:hypothetical protein